MGQKYRPKKKLEIFKEEKMTWVAMRDIGYSRCSSYILVMYSIR